MYCQQEFGTQGFAPPPIGTEQNDMGPLWPREVLAQAHPILWGVPQTHYLDFFIFQVV